MRRDQTLEITLTTEEVADADRMAQETYNKWQAVRGHYSNTLNSHRKGKRGEVAAERWARQNRVLRDSPFRDPNREGEADLVLATGEDAHAIRVDAKTWDERYWGDLGRCLAVGQIESLAMKADAVVWLTLREVGDGTVVVTLRGWSSIDDIRNAPRRMTGRPGMRQVDNYQLEEERLRLMNDLMVTRRGGRD